MLALGLAPAAAALPLEKDAPGAPPASRERVAAPSPPRAPLVRSALVAAHLPKPAVAPRPPARAGSDPVRIQFDAGRPLPVSLDVGMMAAVANDLLEPRPDFLVPRVARPQDDGIERLRPLARR